MEGGGLRFGGRELKLGGPGFRVQGSRSRVEELEFEVRAPRCSVSASANEKALRRGHEITLDTPVPTMT